MGPDGQAESELSAAPKRLRRSWFERGVLGIGVIGVAMCLIAAGALNYGLDTFEAIGKIEIAEVEPAEVGEPSNWLLVGTDSREGIDPNDPNAGVFLGDEAPDGKRTDTMIVARVNPELGRIDLLSIPRDLYVTLPDGSQGRINSTFNGDGGEGRLVETIESQLGIEINHYAEVNFVGFQDIVEALGGVPIWFDTPMRDPGSGLNIESAGCHVLGGFDALAFARARHLEYFTDGAWQTDPSGDLGRSSRQQYFLRRVAATTLKKVNITELGTLTEVLEIGGQNLTIDGGAEAGSLLTLARAFATIEPELIVGHALPVYDFRTDAGAAVLGLETELAQPTLAIFRGEDPNAGPTTTLVPSVYTVLNGSGTPGQASEASTALSAAGLNVEQIDNGARTEVTKVTYPSSMADGAERLAALLPFDPEFEIDDSLTTVVLLTGTDYTGLQDSPRDDVQLPAGEDDAPEDTGDTEVAAPADTTTTTELVGVVPGPTPEGTLCE